MTFHQLKIYIQYRLTSYNEHDLHSPFLFNFYLELLKNPYPFKDFKELALIRTQLKKDSTVVAVTDFGAGSKKLHATTRQIKQITKHGIAPQKQAEFLYRLLNKFNPKTIIELGTSVGLTSLYFAKALPNATVYTIEGCPNLHQYSVQLFKKNKANNIISVNGNFNNEFPKILSTISSLDFLYVDGNHAYEPTINYFKLALQKTHSNSIIVFDDINWSTDMQRAWEEICSHPQVTISLNCFSFGIVLFRTEHKNKEHFVLKF